MVNIPGKFTSVFKNNLEYESVVWEEMFGGKN
jgi:hypothetical protein